MLIISSLFTFFALNTAFQPLQIRKLRMSSLYALFTHDLVVPVEINKERVDAFLAGVFSNYSRSSIGDMCDKGNILVNGKVGKKNFRVSHGDKILLNIETKQQSSVAPENIPISILYEDEYIIAVNKAAGMVVHPAPGSPNGTFVNALLHHLGDKASPLLLAASEELQMVEDMYEKDELDIESESDAMKLDLPETPEAANASPQSLRPGIVHRLDKGTSGVLLAAKTVEAVGKLSALFAKREVRKVYLAVCLGHPGETTVVEPIGRSTKNRQTMTVYEGPPGKPAVSHFRTLSFDGKLSAVLARIETGRTHQIRVHLQHRRTPILGDETYGNLDWNKKANLAHGIDRPLLHAYETEFIHPFTGKSKC